ncbi:hypothetical protein XA68_12800 [Ophiocordyceps unilateralis]|uniref:Uncharacterized protein n=1 Tax=Ophiocordyceps unilateralis TaxID=268505 RepID=A0A2A9PCF4_OPHUN|nr:hypothetical protein XA68_12800 [Ophiocordyceps unilateralis]
MRAAAILVALGALAAHAVPDVDKLNKAFADTGSKMQALADAIDKWPGTILTGGELVCQALEVRKSLDHYSKVVNGIRKISEAERKRAGIHIIRLADPALNLNESFSKATGKFNNNPGAMAAIYEVVKAEKKAYLELIASTVKKMPGSISKSGVPGSQDNLADYVQKFSEKEWDRRIEHLKPPPEHNTTFDQYIAVLAKHATWMNLTPLCPHLPALLKSIGSGEDVKFEAVVDLFTKVLKASGITDDVSIQTILGVAKTVAVEADNVRNVLSGFLIFDDFFKSFISVADIIELAPSFVKQLRVADFAISPQALDQLLGNLLRGQKKPQARVDDRNRARRKEGRGPSSDQPSDSKAKTRTQTTGSRSKQRVTRPQKAVE